MSWDLSVAALLLGLTAAGVAYLAWRGRGQTEIYQEVGRMAAQVEELTLRVVELELDRSGYRLWNAQLRGQIIELGHKPVPPPPWLVATATVGAEPAAAGSVLVKVYHRVSDHFSLEEMGDLAFQSGIDGEAFGGDTKSARAQALVEHAARHGKLAELVRVARRLRPDAGWPVVATGNGYQSLFGKE